MGYENVGRDRGGAAISGVAALLINGRFRKRLLRRAFDRNDPCVVLVNDFGCCAHCNAEIVLRMLTKVRCTPLTRFESFRVEVDKEPIKV